MTSQQESAHDLLLESVFNDTEENIQDIQESLMECNDHIHFGVKHMKFDDSHDIWSMIIASKKYKDRHGVHTIYSLGSTETIRDGLELVGKKESNLHSESVEAQHAAQYACRFFLKPFHEKRNMESVLADSPVLLSEEDCEKDLVDFDRFSKDYTLFAIEHKRHD